MSDHSMILWIHSGNISCNRSIWTRRHKLMQTAVSLEIEHDLTPELQLPLSIPDYFLTFTVLPRTTSRFPTSQVLSPRYWNWRPVAMSEWQMGLGASRDDEQSPTLMMTLIQKIWKPLLFSPPMESLQPFHVSVCLSVRHNWKAFKMSKNNRKKAGPFSVGMEAAVSDR